MKDFRDVVHDAPDLWLGHFGLGETLFHSREVKDRRKSYLTSSVEALERAIQLHPEQPEPRLVLASQLGFHEFDQAAVHYRKATEATSTDCDERIYLVCSQAEDHWEFALAAAKNGQLDLARSAFENALKLNREYRTTPPRSGATAAAFDCWIEAALRHYVPNHQALSEQEALLWRLWLRQHRLKLYQQGTAAFAFLVQRCRERHPDFPIELLELATFPETGMTSEIGTLSSIWLPDKSTPPQALVDISVGVREPDRLIVALADVGDQRALQPIITMLEKPTASGAIRVASFALMIALGKLGGEQAVKALVYQLNCNFLDLRVNSAGNSVAHSIAEILERKATEISVGCLNELLDLKHEYRLGEVTTDRGGENEWSHSYSEGVDVSRVKRLAEAELDRRMGAIHN